MRRGPNGISTFGAGLLALVLIVVASYFGFTKSNPFADPFKFEATFRSANNLKQNSPVRIAGVDVGKVTKVEPLGDGSGAARVVMEMQDKGLPIHKDAELKVRPRIFLEGNFFVDLKPGSPSQPKIEDGDTIPSNQTATPVQFGQILTALQSDTRSDLKVLLKEYSSALDKGGAEAFRRAVPWWEPAYRNSALANDATLGERPGDLHRLMRGQAKTFRALATNERALKDLVTHFNTTAAAFAREDVALQQTVPELRDVLRVGSPALRSLNASFPSLRAFAREALPGVRSSGPTIDASLPFIKQARRLVSERELKGLARDLRATMPSLVRLNRDTIPLLEQNRALSACQNKVLLPFANETAPDVEFPENSKPFAKQGPQSLVALAGESRLVDSVSPMFHVNFLGGPTTVVNDTASLGKVFGQTGFPVEGTRPANPESSKRPQFRPDVPCETQQPPDLHAAKGAGDETRQPSGPIPPLPDIGDVLDVLEGVVPARGALGKNRDTWVEYRQLVEHINRDWKGQPSVDPLDFDEKGEQLQAKRLGMKFTDDGELVKRKDEKEADR
jgi:phospholipid/cholesterol/gamma-HCH transport system substrate-binding protein